MKYFHSLAFPVTGFIFSGVGLLAASAAFYLLSSSIRHLSPKITENIISICGIPTPDSQVDASLLALEDTFVYADTGRIRWGVSPYPQPVPNSEAQTALIADKLYSFGGFDKKKRCCTPTDRAYVFDPASGWSAIKNMPAMNGTQHGGVTHAGFTTDGTDIYFAGGYTSDASGYRQIFGTNEVWKYTVSADDYARMPDLPEPLSAGEMEYIDGKLYWVGGTNLPRTKDLGTLYVLDLADTASGWQPLSSMPNPRNHLGSAVYNGKLYVFGGQHGHDGKLVTQNAVHCYDPVIDTWTEKASMPKALSHITGATFTYGDQIFVMGGERANGPQYYVSDVVAYNPLTDNWTLYPGMPAKRTSGVANIIDGKIYYSTGYGNTTTFAGDMLEIAVPGQPTPTDSTAICTPDAGIWLEAECADTVGTLWKQQTDLQASAGSYLAVPLGTNNLERASEAREAVLTYQFGVDTSAEHTIYGRVLASEGNQNSFWIKIDDNDWKEWLVTVADTLQWAKAGMYALDSGSHRLLISYREGGTGLDQLLITTGTCQPIGKGSDTTAVCVVEDNQPPIARAGADTTVFTETDSALVVLDGGASSDADGEIENYTWTIANDTIAEGKQPQISLPVGIHKVMLQVADNRGLTDTSSVTVAIEKTPLLDIVYAKWLEAECADTVGSHWVVTPDADASNNSYLSFESSQRYDQDATDFSTADITTYHFSVDQQGAYYLFGRAKSTNNKNSQLWVQLDGGVWMLWDMRTLTTDFSWQGLSGDSIVLDSNSNYTLKIAAQGTLDLDKLYISSKNRIDSAADIVVGCENRPITVVVGLDDEPTPQQDITVYPNPGRGIFTIELPDDVVSFKEQMTVYSADGKMIRQLPLVVNATDRATLDLSGVAAGVYLLQLRIGDDLWVRRIEKL